MCDKCLDGTTKSERRSACMKCSQMVDTWVTHVRYTSQACLIPKKHSCSEVQAFCVVPGGSRYQGSTPPSSSDGQSSLGFKGQHCRTRSTVFYLRRSIILLIRQLIVRYGWNDSRTALPSLSKKRLIILTVKVFLPEPLYVAMVPALTTARAI
jgi:hypothetical protein